MINSESVNYPVIAIIPARGGSKGVKNKNLRKVGQCSLLERAIKSASNVESINIIIVTTDSVTIADEAKGLGAEVIFRPSHLADDNSRTIDAVIHTLDIKTISQGVCVLLQPTSPFRTSHHVEVALEKFYDTQANSLVSVSEASDHPFKMLVIEPDNIISPVRSWSDLESPRQALPKIVKPNGAIYVNKIEDLHKYRSFFTQPMSYLMMDAESSLDIDTEYDLKQANLVEEGNYE
ncbi:cytidylyltransferase domain-containing protein [Cobetia amphilecti]|uniref:acylneuraminate cytidylyltransferase family protein n=1 Tax=Cobetia amphilecti TaxID=1055104 RepID=UPI00254CB805|nr:acylneuraminate cytidylyltransferase family protein [Cobetia amphilecti]